jgi:three-Cys-motif partner protein
MINSSYWHIKPHTERKLEILTKYLNAWCDIIFGQYQRHPDWKTWQTPFFVDCFSGRGMYHKDNQSDSVKGSPIIAIEKFIDKKNLLFEKHKLRIYPKCRFVESKEEYFNDLQQFIEPYRSEIDIKVIHADFNNAIRNIVNETGSSPTLFFVDPGGIKELKKESVEAIVQKRGARDILLNYVVDGQIRVGGLGKHLIGGTYKGNNYEGAYKTIESLQDFIGMGIEEFLDCTDNDYIEALYTYVSNVLHANNKLQIKENQLQTIVFDMKDRKRNKLAYFLLFSTRKSVAKSIMKDIFKESKKKESNQMTIFDVEFPEIN